MKNQKQRMFVFNRVYPQKTAPSDSLTHTAGMSQQLWEWTNLLKMIYKSTAGEVYWILDAGSTGKTLEARCSPHPACRGNQDIRSPAAGLSRQIGRC